LNKLDPELGFVTPDDLACSSGLICQYDFKLHRNAGCCLNLEARAGLGEITNRAWDRMLSEKDFPGLQHSPSRRWLPFIHECSLLDIGDQSEMRGWIAGVHCIADFP